MKDSLTQQKLRPPAVPLIACDPYFSVWSCADKLTDKETQHWTGASHDLTGLLRVDGDVYRFMGKDPNSVPAMEQEALSVLPTRTMYRFSAAGVELLVTFMTPTLVHDLSLLSRPTTYVTFAVRSTDGKQHQVQCYFDVSGSLAVNEPTQKVSWSRVKIDDLRVLRMGSQEQRILERVGDDLRIDWGYLYLVSEDGAFVTEAIGRRREAVASFSQKGTLPTDDDCSMPMAVSRNNPVMAMQWDFGAVGAESVSHFALLAYDDLFCIEYLHRRLLPYWRRHFKSGVAELLKTAVAQYHELAEACAAYDAELMSDLVQAGGQEYAELGALAFRQCTAAHKLAADVDGTPLLFSKENFSNGCIATVDVTYPSSPFFLLLNPELLKAAIRPILNYARLDRWPFPFAPHDVGTYPLANGQVYGGGEKTLDRQMPVEECGNMLLMAGALAAAEDDAGFAEQYWGLFTQWAEYLKDKGFDPDNQLCTDDFAGHLAHNANLSVKAILGMKAYASLCARLGHHEEAAAYDQLVTECVQQWMQAADDGDHYRLAFDQPGTWSQKYNLVWDSLLGFNAFPSEVVQKELAYYKTKNSTYGLPLDNRKEYTKLDWIVWIATLTPSIEEFGELMSPLYAFVNESPSRVPLTDWYWTHTAEQVGFQARSVVGGVFIKLLADPQIWEKWVQRAQ